MAELEKRIPISAIVPLVILIGVLVVFTILAFKTNPFMSYMGIAVIAMLFAVAITEYEFNPIHRNKTVVGGNLEIGSVIKPLEYIGGGQYQLIVSCKKRYAPESERGFLTGMLGITVLGAGNTAIKLRGFKSDFIEFESTGTNPEGGIFFTKSFDGKPCKLVDSDLRIRNEELEHGLMKINTLAQNFKSLAVIGAKEQHTDMMDIARQLATMVKQLQQTPAVIMPPQQGQSSNQGGAK